MPPRIQRWLIILLMVYFTLFGGTFYTDRVAALRIGHQVFTAALLAFWLFTRWRKGQGLPRTALDRPLAVYGLVWIVSAIFALDPRVSLEFTWPILTHILGFYLLVDIMQRGRQRWIMEALFVSGATIVLLSAIEMAAWYMGFPLSPAFTQSWPAIGGLTLPPVTHKLSLALNVSTLLGNFTASLLPIIAVWAMTARQRDLRVGLWLLTAGIAATLVLTGSRGALMALAVSTGVLTLTWLLKANVRQRFPALLRPLLNPRVLIAGSAVAGLLMIAGVLMLTLNSPLRSGDTNRLDMWRSALDMTADHPILGVGPHQFGTALRLYGDPALEQSQTRMSTAHNVFLNTLAEGGIVGFGVAIWLGITFARVWWRQWQSAHPARRRRLEGIIAMMAGFGVQSLVDTFTLTPLLMPVFLGAAYTVAGQITRTQAVRQDQPPPAGQRRVAAALLALIVIAQIGMLPFHAGVLAHERALRELGNGHLDAALDAESAAQAADPWLILYPLQAAYIQGLMANDDPAHLDAAIAAHESAQALDPTWDVGWHNLAALYAQAGRFEDAVRAQTEAVAIYPNEAGYNLKLGEYYETLGNAEAARDAYLTAFSKNHNLGSSGFWSDPAHPERAAILTEALNRYADDPDVGLRLAVEADALDIATAIAAQTDPDSVNERVRRDLGDWAMLHEAITGYSSVCPECYFLQNLTEGRIDPWQDYRRLAEIALNREGNQIEELGMTAEQLARTALFSDPAGAARGWYVLAKLAEENGAEDATINGLLVRVVPPLITRQEYAMAIYGQVAALDILPQARFPVLYRSEYEPWLWLAERFIAAGDTTRARRVYEVLLDGDPYLWDVRALMENLPQ
jgi:putative inorganic carbon (HCO3(-)) transporter